ncbi:MAG: hypothetical protein HW412_2508 [Bacteroidetes bacterium]|nr:hypothetical protein [Bacteroidota bacterium]
MITNCDDNDERIQHSSGKSHDDSEVASFQSTCEEMNKLYWNATAIVAGLLSCSCSDSSPPNAIGDDFHIDVVGSAPALHVPGNALLLIREHGKYVPVWRYITPEGHLATNGICVFNGGLDDRPEWQAYPALLAFQKPGPVVDITEKLTLRLCQQRSRAYEMDRGKYVYLWPKFTNGTFSVTAHRRPTSDPDRNGDWVEVRVKQAELMEIIESVKKTGVKRKYRGIEYRIADPVEPSNEKEN